MERPDPMICGSYGATDVAACRNRIEWLNHLYIYDGRDKRDHKMHGVYTGLAQKYQQFTG